MYDFIIISCDNNMKDFFQLKKKFIYLSKNYYEFNICNMYFEIYHMKCLNICNMYFEFNINNYIFLTQVYLVNKVWYTFCLFISLHPFCSFFFFFRLCHSFFLFLSSISQSIKILNT